MGRTGKKLDYTLCLLSVMLVFIPFFPYDVFAQEQVDVGLLPDNPFYFFKLFAENLQEQFTFDNAKRAEVLLEHAEKRRIEIEELERRNVEIPENVVRIQEEKLQKAERIINEIDGTPTTRATETSAVIEQKREQLEKIHDTDSQQQKVRKLKDRLQLAFSDREISEIKLKFNEVVNEEDVEKRRILAQELDEKVNNPIVNLSCFGRINSLSIAQSEQPVKTLQDQCLFLKPIPTEQLRRIMSDADK